MLKESAAVPIVHGAPLPLLLPVTVPSVRAMSTHRMRRIHDAAGGAWDVIEQVSATPAFGQSRLSLVFMGPESVRRVREFPPNWYELSDTELETLSWRV